MSKNNIDWSKAPSDATHYKKQFFYKLKDGVWMYYEGEGLGWNESSNNAVWFKSVVSKEEDLEMTKETKVVRGVDDLEVGMFVKETNGTIRTIIAVVGSKIKTCTFMMSGVILDSCRVNDYYDWKEVVNSWSYTYNGEYAPIVKEVVETEAERKIKELEATIELAQKQLQEYKGMK